MTSETVHTVGIIGAGVAGLATARSLMERGIQCTLFERNAVLGGVWSDGYLNFGAQVQRELYEFPDWPLPDGTPDFTPGPTIHQYLIDFAAHFGITSHIRLSATVTHVGEIDGPNSGWRITWEQDGDEHQQQFDRVVISIGLYSNVPNIPEFPNQEAFSGEIIHNSKLKSAEQLTGKRVAVVGYGKSATDAAIEAAKVGSESHIIFREPHWPIPQKLAGILPFKWGLLHRMNIALLPPYQSATALVKAIHSIGKPLVWFYWRLVETLLFFQCKMGSRFGTRVSLVPKAPIEYGAFSEATMIPKGPFFKLARAGFIGLHRTSIQEYTKNGLILAEGSTLEVDLVVLATGWETDFSFIDTDVWNRLNPDQDGYYLFRHMLHPDVPGMAFVGRASSVSSILTYCIQAHWLAQLLADYHQLPPDQAMQSNIDEMKRWKRSWMPASSARSARLIAHTQNYHDELLRDLNVSPYRKTGFFAPLKEMIFPYQPSDYASIFSRKH